MILEEPSEKGCECGLPPKVPKESFPQKWGQIKCQDCPPKRKTKTYFSPCPSQKSMNEYSCGNNSVSFRRPHRKGRTAQPHQERLFCMSENESFGRAFPLPKIFFCSSLLRLSSFFFIFCFSCSIFICSSIILSLSSA